ncbi:MAG TPA: S8 family serine peptidase [Puia sp.]|jgi:hypothetical protein
MTGLGLSVKAQQPGVVRFKGGTYRLQRNFGPMRLQHDSLRTMLYKRKYYVLVQFDKLPDSVQKQEMTALGLRLFDYLPERTWLAEMGDSASTTELARYGISSISPMPAAYRIASRLLTNTDEIIHDQDQVISINYFGSLPEAEIKEDIIKAGATIVPEKIQPPRTLFVRVSNASILQKLAALPYVSYIAPQPMKARILNYNNRGAHGESALGALSGRNLQGDGVTVGIGDNSSAYTHVDLTGRLIDRSSSTVDDHGTHVNGTVAGGGILHPRNIGMAPHATVIDQAFYDIVYNAPYYLSDYGMQLTSNSYTVYNSGCQYNGEYDNLSYYTDYQTDVYPGLLHIFAAGNDGLYICSPFPQQYFTVKSGFQSAKNSLTVGNIDNTSFYPGVNPGSSSGPVSDGRIKPEIVAGGTNIFSTLPFNSYGWETGTSMATPTVSGTMALLIQRFHQLYGSGTPYSMILKALVCNTANDMGNAGPDYIYGFGSINGRAAVESLEAAQLLTNSISSTGQTIPPKVISVPAGQQQVRVMLYWPDYPAAPFSSTALVNDLDLTVTDPLGGVHRPLILNPAAGHVTDPATEGADHLNNIEQVVINTPTSGNYTLNVAGYSVPAGPQMYTLTWQWLKPAVVVEFPYGNETLVPKDYGELDNLNYVHWNAIGGEPNTFKAEYSPDNGTTWTLIQDNIPSDARRVPWTTPTAPTNQGLVRISRNNTAYSGVSTYNFSILETPVVTVTNTCPGYAQLDWNAVPSASSYDVFQLIGTTMQKTGSTTATTYSINNLNKDSTYWLAVRGVNGSTAGRRSWAVKVQPSSGPCSLAGMDNDYTVDSIIGLRSGRLNTSTQLGNSNAVQIHLRNLGSVPTGSSFNLYYSINGGTPVVENSLAILAAHSGANYTFATNADFSAAGTYTIAAWIKYTGDPNASNDTFTTVVKQLGNAPITLNTSYTENFETAGSGTYTAPTMGFTGLDRCDFYANNDNGRARTFVNTGFARSGTRAVTLDQSHAATATTADSLLMTFNLSGYGTGDQLFLDFYYKNQGNNSVRTANKVWIRGSDQDAWIESYILDTSAANVGVYQHSTPIDITGLFKAASPAQTVSSSFQVKFGEEGFTSANNIVVDNGTTDEGYTFDDVNLSRSTNDIGITALISPDPGSNCSLSSAQAITFKVKNYTSSTVTNVPVTFSINGSTHPEIIPSINGKDSVNYTFTQLVNLSAYGYYTFTGWVKLTGDNYSANDTLAPVTIHTVPLISTFPYLEGFESGDGYWYTGGTNSSWQWGTPAKTIINKAANGSNAWVTNLTGNYNDNEQSYLYSPCFNLSGLAQPVFSFSHIFKTEDACDCDYHYVEYSTDGVSWTKLGSVGSGMNWYDSAAIQVWRNSDPQWHVSSYDVPVRGTSVKFRIVMKSDPATNYEGVGIDDIHVFDKAAVYSGSNITSGLSQTVSGSGWIDFDVAGHRVASINPNGQNLGLTNVKVYFNTGSVRNDGVQYYLDRNIVIQPAIAPTAAVGVRYYFLDAEAQRLINASGCAGCTTIADPYQAGVTQYSNAPAEEDGDLANDVSGTRLFHLPHQDVSIIPYDNGYYAEYLVNGFSEFWINNGGPSNTIALPLTLLSFTAVRSGDKGLLQWNTTNDNEAKRFIIQKSSDGVTFTDLDSLPATADSSTTHSYQYTDTRLLTGANYYRLRMTDVDGRSTWSPVRTIDGSGNGLISIYPNPVDDGTVYIRSSVNCRQLRLTDVSGKLLIRKQTQGFNQTLFVGAISRGIYLLIVDTDTGTTVQKVFIK